MSKNKQYIKVCECCGKEYFTANPRYFLCPNCARLAFQEHICPECGGKILRPGKPLCIQCATSMVGTEGKDSVRCSYVTANGYSCKNYAMKGSYFCWQHAQIVKED